MEFFASASALLPATPRLIFLVVLGCSFVYFLAAGSRTFTSSPTDDLGVLWAQISLMWTGAVTSMILGLIVVPIGVYNGIASAAVLVCSLALYEWARHVIWGRSFYIAWSGYVPDALCDQGPYAYIRHPIYASYLLAFLAMLVAMPGSITLVVFVFNVGLFTHAARSDERSLASSTFGTEYAEYRKRTGMFLPRIVRR
jgi:protein-S-isoprenylcysteine O-methyltransferase Ste14